MELSHWEVVDTPKTSNEPGGSEQKVSGEKSAPMEEGSSNGQLRRGTLRRTGTQGSRQNPDVTPQTIGRETCPICIVDFEEGDDLRVLPCEGKHRFHQGCVDPWLLELSSSCPLCREGKWIVPGSPRSELTPCAQISTLSRTCSLGGLKTNTGLRDTTMNTKTPRPLLSAEDVSQDTSGSLPDGGEASSANIRGILTKTTTPQCPLFHIKMNEINASTSARIYCPLGFRTYRFFAP